MTNYVLWMTQEIDISLHSDEGYLLFAPVRPEICFNKKTESVFQKGSKGVSCWRSGLELHIGKNEIYQILIQNENLFLYQISELLSFKQTFYIRLLYIGLYCSFLSRYMTALMELLIFIKSICSVWSPLVFNFSVLNVMSKGHGPGTKGTLLVYE